MNGVQTRFKCKLDVKRCKRFVFPPSSLLPRSNALKTKAIRYFQTDRTLTRIVSPPLDAGHMDTYDARYEATEKAEAYRTRKISAAVGTFRKEAVLETSAVPEKTVVVEKTEATEAQPSSGEMRFKGGRRELTIRNGSAVLRTNGESFDATDILKDMRAHGVDIGRVSGKAMSEMLKGNKTALPGASGNSVFAIVKGPAGYGLKAFQIAKQVHSAAAQEI